MKKAFSLILVILLMLSLCACAEKPNGAVQPDPDKASDVTEEKKEETKENTKENTEEKDTAETDKKEDTPADSRQEAVYPEPIPLSCRTERMWEMDDAEENIVFRGSYPVIYADNGMGEKYPELWSRFVDITEELSQNVSEAKAEYSGWAKEAIVTDPYFYTYFADFFMTPTRSDELCVSLVFTLSDYSGGIHPNSSYFGVNIDPVTGVNMALTDVIPDLSVLPETIAAKLYDKYGADMFFYDLEEDFRDSYVNGDYDFTWTLTLDGIRFYFSPYEIAPYSMGLLTVDIGYDEMPEIFTEKYLDIPPRYGYILPVGDPAYADADGDGNKDEVTISFEYDGEFYTDIYVTVNGNETKIPDVSFEGISPHFVHTADGKSFIYLEGSGPEGYGTLYILGIDGGKAVLLDSMFETMTAAAYQEFNGVSMLTDPDYFRMGTYTSVLSTATGVRAYRVGDDGLPVPLDDWYTVEVSFPLTVKAEFEAAELDTMTRKETGKKTLIPGTELRFVGTDGETYAVFETAAGGLYRVDVDTAQGWTQFIGGKPAEELLDGMIFAG